VEHVVFYTAADGSPAYRRTASLDDAVRVVEHLRNAEGREDVHVYSLAPVALNFRPYYRVEVNGVHEAPPAAVPAPPAQYTAPAASEATAPPAPPAQQQPAADMGIAEPMPVTHPSPFAEPMHAPQAVEPAMASAGTGEGGEDAGNNGRGRGLGFFTR
jgi:hypothetical protein